MRLLGGSADRRGALAVFNLSLFTLLAATAGVMVGAPAARDRGLS